MELTDLALQYGSLAGVAAFVAVLINIGKTIGVVKDGSSQQWSLALNVIGFLGFIALGVFTPDISIEGLDQNAATLANILLSLLGLFVQLGVSRGTHNTLKGLPLVGKSFSG